MNAVFADTFYFLALFNPRDYAHDEAIEVGSTMSGRLVTTQSVLIEVGDAFSAVKDRPKSSN